MFSLHGDASRPGSLRAAASETLCLLLCLGACSAPEQRPLTPAGLTSAVEQRAATPDQLSQALELAGLAPRVDPSSAASAQADPARTEFWYACAEAWSPIVRAARRNFAAAVQSARSAGQPGPINMGAELSDLSDPTTDSKLAVTFDLVGLFGLEPAAAARALADAQARAALEELESARWRVRFDVDRARVRLAAARAAQAALEQLTQEAEAEAERLAILDRHGRLAAGPMADSQLALRDLRRALELQRIDASNAREALANACGLPPSAAALDQDDARLLAAQPLLDSAPDPRALFERLPALRVALFDYAVAEAHLRNEAAARWPDLSLGPRLAWSQPDMLLGLLATAGLPWPGSLDGQLAAANTQREAARERAEDALQQVLTRGVGARERLTSADALLVSAAQPAELESARLWSAARARLAVQPGALMEWSDALRMRARSLNELEAARAERRLAQLAVEEVSGPEPGAALLARVEELHP